MSEQLLANGVTFQVEHPDGLDQRTMCVLLSPVSLLLLADGHAVRITMRSSAQLVEAARAVGQALVLHSDSLTCLLLLVYIVRTTRIPDQHACNTCQIAARQFQACADHLPQRIIESVSDRQIDQLVQETLTVGQERLTFHGDMWALARTLFAYAAALWHLRGARAAYWGSLDIRQHPNNATMIILVLLSGLVPPAPGVLPVPFAPRVLLHYAVLDWLALAAGPTDPPFALVGAGIGMETNAHMALGRTDERGNLSLAHGKALSDLAATLLASTERPAPRHIGKMLDIAIPPDLIGRLAVFDVTGVLVVPHQHGLWIAAQDEHGTSVALAWWSAAASSAERAPLTFPPAGWMLIHTLLAALWHDLCADAIEVDARPSPRTTGIYDPHGRQTPPAQHHRRVMLPPVRYRARWGSDEERRILSHYTLVDVGYRRLPRGWQERCERADFERRQEAAAVRARANGYDAPPPGFTYVAPHQRPVMRLTGEPVMPRETMKVRSRGLFTLLLGLRREAMESEPL